MNLGRCYCCLKHVNCLTHCLARCLKHRLVTALVSVSNKHRVFSNSTKAIDDKVSHSFSSYNKTKLFDISNEWLLKPCRWSVMVLILVLRLVSRLLSISIDKDSIKPFKDKFSASSSFKNSIKYFFLTRS